MAERLLFFPSPATLFFEAKKRPERVFYGKIGDFIEVKRQQTGIDCGQTCLEMLGYAGRELFPNGPLWTDQLLDISPSLEDIIALGQEGTTAYNEPHMVYLKKDRQELIGPDLGHWVIRVNDTIICPTSGVQDAVAYQKERDYRSILAFKLQMLPQDKTSARQAA